MIPERERLVQLARLIGVDAFARRFGSPPEAEREPEALRGLIDERLDGIVAALVGEAAASDDVIDGPSAMAFLDDRLRTFGDILAPGQAKRIRTSFAESTAAW